MLAVFSDAFIIVQVSQLDNNTGLMIVLNMSNFPFLCTFLKSCVIKNLTKIGSLVEKKMLRSSEITLIFNTVESL